MYVSQQKVAYVLLQGKIYLCIKFNQNRFSDLDESVWKRIKETYG